MFYAGTGNWMHQLMYFLFSFPVTRFAKKTGDYGSLSPVDLKVMALTHQLLCEEQPELMACLRDMPSREVRKSLVTV